MPALPPTLGVLAAVLGIADMVPYVRDTMRGVTRPYRGTWLIWGVLGVVVTVAQWADGASWSLGLVGPQSLLTCLVFFLAIRYGEGGLTAIDLSLIAVASAGVIGWALARDPALAVVCVVVADLCAATMMAPKAYRDPYSETLSTYALASAGGAVGAGAVGALDASLLLYPIYYCAVNGALALLICLRRRQPAW